MFSFFRNHFDFRRSGRAIGQISLLRTPDGIVVKSGMR